jgi:hypothetical protein
MDIPKLVDVRIYYTESTTIKLEFYPGNAKFDYWLDKKVAAERWRRVNEDDIWLGCEITAEEATYIENFVVCQFGRNCCEVFRPLKKQEAQENRVNPIVQIPPVKLVTQPPKDKIKVDKKAGTDKKIETEEFGQLSLL